jgi:hypothetical protein
MLIPQSTYYIGLVILLVLIAGTTFLIGKRKNNKTIGSVGFVVALALFIFSKWVFPNVYTVSKCGDVKKEIMILPKTTEKGLPIAYGKHCYLLNKSSNELYVETIFYGNESPEKSPEQNIDENMAPQAEKEFKIVSLDHFFEPEEQSVRTKSSGEIRHKVSCAQ